MGKGGLGGSEKRGGGEKNSVCSCEMLCMGCCTSTCHVLQRLKDGNSSVLELALPTLLSA